ncbi:CDC45-like protein [Lepidopterella palustris CBS 459.81]|uniref:CDC45-like protein n=1 Tax=Lepidopterella palustris CBS 459.81 TaxID=1314670 RepID=A0A8E2E2S2_9PEZI|nr:CDC45-like protein [Lepidopterella palustris CBS 459.81]
MYLPRSLISHLYLHLLRTHHPLSPPVLLLVALEPDALCACRILTALLKRDYIPHKIQPIAGYGDLIRAGEELIRPMRTTDGGSGGVVICLGVGGLVDLEEYLKLEVDENGQGGPGDVEVWVMDARRPYNLTNVFGAPPGVDPQTGELVRRQSGVSQGRIMQSYKPGRGGIIVFDDGDIEEELGAERDAYCALEELPEVGEDDDEGMDASDIEQEPEEKDVPVSGQAARKRKSWEGGDDSEEEDEQGPARQRRRSNSSTSIPSSPERSERPARRGLLSTTNRLGGSSDFSRSDSPPSRSPSLAPPEQPKQQSIRALRQQLINMRRKHNSVLHEYYALGASYSEPVSSLVYSLASELGREDNDLLWNAIVGVSSLELYGRTLNGVGLSPLSTAGGSSGWNGDRGERIRAILRDEVRRLNPIDLKDIAREASLGDSAGVIPTHARSPTDMSIRLSPEPRFLLIRHWSLYDSMLHSPYLSARLHVWSDAGRRRLHKLLAKMGVSLTQCKQSYTHMDMELKRGLRERLLKFAPVYGLDGLVPPTSHRGETREGWGFVRCWGWKACLSATDAGVVLGAILEVGDAKSLTRSSLDAANFAEARQHGEMASVPSDRGNTTANGEGVDITEDAQERITARFWTAYDALSSIDLLVSHISTAQHLHRAILRTGTGLIEKKQIRHLRAFRMAVVKEGPDVQLFTHPGALIKLALWVAEAIGELNGVKGKRRGGELVMAGLDDARGVYVVVGLGGGGGLNSTKEREKKQQEKKKTREKRREEKVKEKERRRQARIEQALAAGLDEDEIEDDTEEESEASEGSESESESEEVAAEKQKRGYGRNRFGIAFHEVIEETQARVKIDSFEACVVEVRKEDLSGFLESLSMKAVVG